MLLTNRTSIVVRICR